MEGLGCHYGSHPFFKVQNPFIATKYRQRVLKGDVGLKTWELIGLEITKLSIPVTHTYRLAVGSDLFAYAVT